MRCPFCHYFNTQVKDSREASDGFIIRRRRSCFKCLAKFTTTERIQMNKMQVIKRSGEREGFNREKIITSITPAIRKRNITSEQVDKVLDNIFKKLNICNIKEITTIEVGEVVMEELIKLDEISYIRFASVYKDFDSVEDFINCIDQIKK